MKRRVAVTAAVLTITAVACTPSDRSGSESVRASLLTISTPADADAIVPLFVQSTQGKQVADLVFDHLARPTGESVTTTGDASFRGELAERWEWASDSLSITFHLNPDARWHDGHAVTASDVQFSFALFTDPEVASPIASSFAGVDSVTVKDRHRAVVWWTHRSPEQFYQVTYNLAVLPRHLLDTIPRQNIAASRFTRQPIGSGRYRFEQWTERSRIVLAADSGNYRGQPTFSRIVWLIAPDPTVASMRVLAGEADVLEQLRDDAYDQVSRSTTVSMREYGSYDYAYMLMNMERTVAGSKRLFADRAMRAALTHAIDREAVVQNVLGPLGRVAIGPMTRAASGVDTTLPQLAFDTAAAMRVLDSLGWRMSPDGLRRRDGRVLAFEILVPASSGTRKRVGVLLQEQLRRVGVSSNLASVEPGVFFDRLQRGRFDVALNMWRAVPGPASLREVWGSRSAGAATPNFGAYSNRHFDALVDSAIGSYDAASRDRFVRRAHRAIVDDAAAVWLYEPRNVAAVSKRITPTGMRADAWWAEIANWKVSGAALAGR